VAAVVHHEDRVLVADDGRVPMVEVDDAVAVSDASLTADYYWLLKVGQLQLGYCQYAHLLSQWRS